MRQVLPIVWYRFRATFTTRWSGYLSVVILIGLTGGTAMAAMETARRTQSSYPTFLASTNPSDMTVSVYVPNSGAGVVSLTAKIRRLPGVKEVRDIVAPLFAPLTPNGAPNLSALGGSVTIVGSLEGVFFDQDRPAIVRGREARPGRADEMEMTSSAARLLGVHLGQVVKMGFYTAAQEGRAGFGTARVAPRFRVSVKLVGIAVFNNTVVQDDIDRAYGFVILTPALVRRAVAVAPAAGAPVSYALQLDDGGIGVPAVEQEVVRLVPPHATAQFHVTSRVVTEVELALKPESVAIGGFGAIAALVCLVLGAQVISRQLRWGDADRGVMRALGASPAVTATDGLVGTLGGLVLGSFFAGGMAVALSPLSPWARYDPSTPIAGSTLTGRCSVAG